MQDFMSFVIRHWELWLAFVLILGYWIGLEFEEHYRGRGVSTQHLVNYLNRKEGVVVDIRSEEQFRQGHIIGALSFPEKDLFQQLAKLKKYQQKPVILVDATGAASNKILNKLGSQGFQDVYYLKNGWQAWLNASMPVHKE